MSRPWPINQNWETYRNYIQMIQVVVANNTTRDENSGRMQAATPIYTTGGM